MIIAVDFDGTIVEHKYPKIGAPIPFAIETLLQLQKEHHTLILWSVREGKYLEQAIEYCASKGLEFYAANSNYPEEDRSSAPRKLMADLFIDDRNLGGLPNWGIIYQMVQAQAQGKTSSFEQMIYQSIREEYEENNKGFFNRIKRLFK